MSGLVTVVASSVISRRGALLCRLLRSLFGRRVLIRRPLSIWLLTLPLWLLLAILHLLLQLLALCAEVLTLGTQLLALIT